MPRANGYQDKAGHPQAADQEEGFLVDSRQVENSLPGAKAYASNQ